jgi:hypothetical protein
MSATNYLLVLAALMTTRMTKAALAEKFDVSTRTVKRYLRKIEGAGFEVRWNFIPHPTGSCQDVRIYWVAQTPPIPLVGHVT